MDTTKNTGDDLSRQLKSFDSVWRGGYYEGDVLDPLSPSTYGPFGYISILHAVYLYCIRPYVTGQSIVLEIGPGRGAWTKTMLDAREVWCLDAKSREDNDIDHYLGSPKNLVYHQVHDFACRELPDDKFDFLFSFGALCHVSWDGIVQYSTNLFPKLRSGANCFFMIADYDKKNHVNDNQWQYNVVSRVLSAQRMRPIRVLDRKLSRALGRRSVIQNALGPKWFSRLERIAGWYPMAPGRKPFDDKDEATEPRPGRWFHAGAERTAEMLKGVGYVIVDKDIDLNTRDPIIHFRKP